MVENLTKGQTLNHRSRKLREHQAGYIPKNQKKTTPKNIVFKLKKDKEKILKEFRGENTFYIEKQG